MEDDLGLRFATAATVHLVFLDGGALFPSTSVWRKDIVRACDGDRRPRYIRASAPRRPRAGDRAPPARDPRHRGRAVLFLIRSVPTWHRCVLRRVLSGSSGRSRESMPRLLEKVQKGRVACEVLGLGQPHRSFEHQDNKRKPVHGARIYHADPSTKYTLRAPIWSAPTSPRSRRWSSCNRLAPG